MARLIEHLLVDIVYDDVVEQHNHETGTFDTHGLKQSSARSGRLDLIQCNFVSEHYR